MGTSSTCRWCGRGARRRRGGTAPWQRTLPSLTREILGAVEHRTLQPTTWSASMTDTTTDRPVGTSAARSIVTRWLADFERALTDRDIDAAADLFVEDCYWRDLVAFTWNIVTVEGRDGVREMLGQTLDRVRPSGFAVAGELGEAGADTESWIKFETSVGRGLGHLRLRDGKAWTLLTTLNELTGYEEQKSDRRPKGTEHGAVPDRKTWLEQYTRVMELNYWASTECNKASYDETAREWTVVVERDGVEMTLRPKQLVLATGMSGKPSMPEFEGMHLFTGDQHHSSQHPGPDAYRGKKAVVIGSNNSAHDICAALWEVGADVTMVQRSSTHVSRSDSLMELGLGALYSESAVASGMTTQKADLTFASLPYRILHMVQIPVYNAIRERDADFYARLEKAGFMLDFGEDDSGLFMKYLRRGSGYYIDVGASELVANGDIKLESGVDVVQLTENAVVLSNGKTLPADLVVYATGYGSMNGWAADLISPEVAAKVGKCWGLGSGTTKDPEPWEGELRNMWKPTQQEALWFHGGNLHQSRHYSLYLALQLKARMEGIPTPVYGLQEVHHLS